VRQALIRRVRRGDAKYARRLTNSRTVIVLDHDGDEMAFLYSNAAKDILSFLPRDAAETADWRRLQSLELFHPGPLGLDGGRQ
jgi:LmbE family N-acetylglucosaminyl deacetylase